MKIPVSTGKAISTIAVCVLSGYCMKLTNGDAGVGLALIGLFFIWAS